MRCFAPLRLPKVFALHARRTILRDAVAFMRMFICVRHGALRVMRRSSVRGSEARRDAYSIVTARNAARRQ